MSERQIKEKKKCNSQEQLRIICCSQEQINDHRWKRELLTCLFPPYFQRQVVVLLVTVVFVVVSRIKTTL